MTWWLMVMLEWWAAVLRKLAMWSLRRPARVHERHRVLFR